MVYENESMITKTILQLVIKVYTNLSWLRTGQWRKTVNSKIYVYISEPTDIYLFYGLFKDQIFKIKTFSYVFKVNTLPKEEFWFEKSLLIS